MEAALVDYKEDGNTESIWMALRDVVEARAAVSELSKRTGIDTETLLDAPQLNILSTILKSFECQLPIDPRTDVKESYSQTPTNQ